jgi:DNA-binding PadR family transcriptional regulator
MLPRDPKSASHLQALSRAVTGLAAEDGRATAPAVHYWPDIRASTLVLLIVIAEYRIPIYMTDRVRAKIARGSAEVAILTLLNEEPLYGFQIAKRIEERTNGALRFTMASLYPMLYELEKRQLVKGHWENNQAGRDRRYYSLTPAGRKELIPLRREWEVFFRALNSLAGVSHA